MGDKYRDPVHGFIEVTDLENEIINSAPFQRLRNVKQLEKYGPEYDITPELICDIYRGRLPGENSEFTFLKSFMDSELDCDKMDYLLRDSLFCGVKYGNYDIERLLSSLTIYIQDGCPRLAIGSGGTQGYIQ